MTSKKIYLYPIWVRLWHIVNAITFLLLVATGISLHFTDPSNVFIPFATSVAIHNVCAIILTFAYGVYIIGNMISGNGKYYRGWKTDIKKNMMPQVRYYVFGIFKKEKHPFPVSLERKFNPLQKISYIFVIFVALPLLIISGIGLMFPKIVVMDAFGLSGLALTDYLHQITGFLLSIFLIIHLYTCTLGDKPATLFKSIINGYHEEHE
jgi:thiosulfate reductase cytochrome b subunit